MKKQRQAARLVRTAAALMGLVGALTLGASAMHIAEGYLPPT